MHLIAYVINVDSATFNMVVGLLLPIVTAVLVKLHASDSVKATVTLVLSGVAAAAQSVYIDGLGAVFTKSTLLAFLGTFITAVGAYKGLWKQTPLLGNINARLAPSKGIGTPQVPDLHSIDPDPHA